jgi:lysophospholipase L1-like esterase
MRPHPIAPTLLLALALATTTRAQDKPFTLPDAPRIAFIGNTFVERDAEHGYFETRLILTFPDKDIVFRNVGWSGDTVRGEARAGFGQPADGFNRLAKHVADLKPNLIFLNYGVNESWAGPAGLPAFDADLAKMLDTLTKAGGTQVVVFSIMAQENLGPPLPNPDAHNKDVRLYNQTLAKAAAARGMRFVDLYDLPFAYATANPGRHFTENEIHPTPAGFAFAAEQIARRLGLPDRPWDDRAEKVRRLTVEKNRLYFHRWRPENETYIFGFRKKEQGQNAVEIPQFDPLVAAKEVEINAAKK